LLEDDGSFNGANLAGMNMQLQNSMGIPGLFNAPNQLFLAQQMRGGTQGFSPEMWNTMMTGQRGGQAGMGNMSLLLPQYAMAPGQVCVQSALNAKTLTFQGRDRSPACWPGKPSSALLGAMPIIRVHQVYLTHEKCRREWRRLACIKDLMPMECPS